MSGEPYAVLGLYLVILGSSITMGFLMRLFANPHEASYLKKRIEELTKALPPKHMRTTPKIVKKARIIESELSRIRRKYMLISFKRITAVFIVYGITLALIVAKFPPFLESPVAIPIITFLVEGKPMVPSTYVYLMGILLLSPIAMRLSEPPE